jgi:hypothetical protein
MFLKELECYMVIQLAQKIVVHMYSGITTELDELSGRICMRHIRSSYLF